MKGLTRYHNQAGFTLVQAIFAVVVLSLLALAMMRLIGVQSATSVMAVQQARAYQAARSGLDWGAARASAAVAAGTADDSECNGNFDADDFTVTVSCTSQSFTEGTTGPYKIYRLSASAVYGTIGSVDYVKRTAEVKVGFP